MGLIFLGSALHNPFIQSYSKNRYHEMHKQFEISRTPLKMFVDPIYRKLMLSASDVVFGKRSQFDAITGKQISYPRRIFVQIRTYPALISAANTSKYLSVSAEKYPKQIYADFDGYWQKSAAYQQVTCCGCTRV